MDLQLFEFIGFTVICKVFWICIGFTVVFEFIGFTVICKVFWIYIGFILDLQFFEKCFGFV